MKFLTPNSKGRDKSRPYKSLNPQFLNSSVPQFLNSLNPLLVPFRKLHVEIAEYRKQTSV